jgi:hypothetical protein
LSFDELIGKAILYFESHSVAKAQAYRDILDKKALVPATADYSFKNLFNPDMKKERLSMLFCA